VWMAYAELGFDFGSIEAFYQLQWNNTRWTVAAPTGRRPRRSFRPAPPAATWARCSVARCSGFTSAPASSRSSGRSPGWRRTACTFPCATARASDQRAVRLRVPFPGREDRHGNRRLRDEHPQPAAGHLFQAAPASMTSPPPSRLCWPRRTLPGATQWPAGLLPSAPHTSCTLRQACRSRSTPPLWRAVVAPGRPIELSRATRTGEYPDDIRCSASARASNFSAGPCRAS